MITIPDQLSPCDAQRPQGGVVVCLHHHLARHRLSHKQQRDEQRKDREEDERHDLEVDPALGAGGHGSDAVGCSRGW